jgi:hypothetical protein
MEVIKKKIKQALKIEKRDDNKYIITPDLSVDYNMRVLLTSKSLDIGFFDPYPDTNVYAQANINLSEFYGDDVSGIGEDLLADDNFI